MLFYISIRFTFIHGSLHYRVQIHMCYSFCLNLSEYNSKFSVEETLVRLSYSTSTPFIHRSRGVRFLRSPFRLFAHSRLVQTFTFIKSYRLRFPFVSVLSTISPFTPFRRVIFYSISSFAPSERSSNTYGVHRL